MNLAQNEVLNTPQNDALKRLEGSENFVHPYRVVDNTKEVMKTQPAILLEMMHIPETEKILFYDYIVIKPVGINAAIG